MSSKSFPFPGRDLAVRELASDPCYARIPESDRSVIADAAWDKGASAARMVFERTGGEGDFRAILSSDGVSVVERDVDNVVGGQRYFSDYVSGRHEITLYLRSVGMWADQNHLGVDEATNLILAHEYYHHLECDEIGLASREYQVPMVQAGPLRLGHTGIRALSEIGAHAFVRTYHDLLRKGKGKEAKA